MTADEYKALMEKRAPKTVNKYRNIRKVVNGLSFDSVKEARHYQDLVTWQQSGQITELQRQVPFAVEINGHHIGFYYADFSFKKDGKLVVEDVKSRATKTDLYKWKKKCVEALHGVEIIEI